MDLIVEMEKVSVARGESVILQDVSLRIARGGTPGDSGPNGCGKSTLMKTMTCELYPLVREGTRVRILGRERWDLTELKRRMGVVSAELPGKQTLTTSGLDAVVTGYFGSSTLWPNLQVTAEMREHADEVLLQVGGAALRAKLVGEMSAGQQRRVMIARAMVGNRGVSGEDNAQMLLLDEPSNALDLAAQQDLRELLRELAAKGTAIVLITHHIGDILPEMERVVMMRAGRIVEDGVKRELLQAKKLSELFGRGIEMSERGGWFNAW